MDTEEERRFTALFGQCYRPVLAYALRRTQGKTQAEDVVAETFLVAWRRLGDVPAGADTLPWLLGVARRVLANARRGDSRRCSLVARLKQYRLVADIDGHAEDEVTSEYARSYVTRALGRLRPADAEILQLVNWEQLSHAQIAVALDCSANAVAIRLYRARKALAEELQRGGYHPGQGQMAAPGAPGALER